MVCGSTGCPRTQRGTDLCGCVNVCARVCCVCVQIESGMCAGQVLYHAHVAKTPEEAAALKAKHEERLQLKETRRRQQVSEFILRRKGCMAHVTLL